MEKGDKRPILMTRNSHEPFHWGDLDMILYELMLHLV